jgi:hypothetical protein
VTKTSTASPSIGLRLGVGTIVVIVVVVIAAILTSGANHNQGNRPNPKTQPQLSQTAQPQRPAPTPTADDRQPIEVELLVTTPQNKNLPLPDPRQFSAGGKPLAGQGIHVVITARGAAFRETHFPGDSIAQFPHDQLYSVYDPTKQDGTITVIASISFASGHPARLFCKIWVGTGTHREQVAGDFVDVLTAKDDRKQAVCQGRHT